MSAFTALNIEYDNVSEQEVDDTKELQIEEALKLYQEALKFHADGPQSYDKALDAYRALFDSEIFKYPESQSELRRSEDFANLPEYEELWVRSNRAGPVQLAVPQENAPNTLPQIVHLSYKNHGQFLLDLLQHNIREHLRGDSRSPISTKQVANGARLPLNYYAEALDKDDTDVDLWRCTAAVATLVGSSRITRFCLEAVLDMGEDSLDDVLGSVGIEETIALQLLQELAAKLEDDLSLMVAPLSKFRRKKLAEALRKRLESHSAIPRPAFDSTAYSIVGHTGRTPTRYVITAPRRDWAAVGEVILQQLHLEQGGVIDVGPGVGIGIKLPDAPLDDPTVDEALLDETPLNVALEDIDTQETRSAVMDSRMELDTARAEPNVCIAEREGYDDDAAEIHGAETEHDKVPTVSMDQPLSEKVTQSASESISQPPTEKTADASELQQGPSELDRPEIPQSPSRKRSTDSAGLPEVVDDGRVRSKRIRARRTLDGEKAEGTSIDPSRAADDALSQFILADEKMFETVNTILGQLDAEGLGSPVILRDAVKESNTTISDSDDQLLLAMKDLYDIARNCTPDMTNILVNGLNGESINTIGAATGDAGLNAFLRHTKFRDSGTCAKPVLDPTDGLLRWLENVNAPWTYTKDAAWQFLLALLGSGSFPSQVRHSTSSYVMHRWSDDLKRAVVQIAVQFDDHVFPLVDGLISKFSINALSARTTSRSFVTTVEDLNLIEMIQTLFELHLDVYSLIKHPASAVDASTQMKQKHRLEKWSSLANTALNLRSEMSENIRFDELAIRHIWATAFHISVCDNVSQTHVLACMRDLKELLGSLGGSPVYLQNNAVMPEISLPAIEQELNKISMQDFFAKVFHQDHQDPVTTIESLEPLLEFSVNIPEGSKGEYTYEDKNTHGHSPEDSSPTTSESLQPSPLQEMSKFLATGTWSLRLSLWQRLRQAYIVIDYTPKVVSCHLRNLELFINEMKSSAYVGSSQDTRNVLLLRWLYLINESVGKLMKYSKDAADALDCIDANHLRTSIYALTSLLRVLHSFNMFEDHLRAGTLPSPTFEGRPKPSFNNAASWVHQLQLRVWVLLYRLLKEGIEQNPEAFPSPAETRFDFLRTVHYSIGLRNFCGGANREFLHVLRDELLDLSDVEQSDVELCQVLLDLYGLKCSPDSKELMDHGCNDAELLTRKTAFALVGFLMAQAEKVPMKDLPKTDLKGAIDKVQACLGRSKFHDDLLLNRRVINSFIRSTINPLDLFSSLRGTLELPTKPILPEQAEVASKGWYFLMGLIALNKFRSQKRLQSGPLEDVNQAVAYFTQDLEYSAERWETWYRLAQAYDIQLEENVAWSAEKINSKSLEVSDCQRAAIHCYAMAVACAVRCGDSSSATMEREAEMYAEYGTRLYSSTREPFAMLAFWFRENEKRHFSGEKIFKSSPFIPLTIYTAWRLAAVLFKRSLSRSPNQWWNHYMLGKCLWKMFSASKKTRDQHKAPEVKEVTNCFVQAIKALPSRRDNRKEPILEPHYKLVSIVNKLVQRDCIDDAAGVDILQATPYASQFIYGHYQCRHRNDRVHGRDHEHDVEIDVESEDESDEERCVAGDHDMTSWSAYVLEALDSLRSADKSGWHHRMTARKAHLLSFEAFGGPDFLSPFRAEATLTPQMFTKTMVLQVWKPENERPGRHFVYTSRYLSFFVDVLVEQGPVSLPTLEVLIRRLRRKPFEFFNHTKLWQETCSAYMKCLRQEGKIPNGWEDRIFKSLNQDDFSQRSARLELWCQDLTKSKSSITLNILRSAIELKKLNNGLSKPTLIDDLIGDAYAALYKETDISPPSSPIASDTVKKPMSLSNVMNSDGGSDTSGKNAFQSNQVASTQVAHAVKPRAKGVGRREVARRAEACVNRPVIATSTSNNLAIRSPAEPSQNQTVQVVIPSRSSPGNAQNGTSAAGLAGNTSAGALSRTVGNGLSGNEGVDGDVDESGSELSELDEEPEEPTPKAGRVRTTVVTMFPGLIRKNPGVPSLLNPAWLAELSD